MAANDPQQAALQRTVQTLAAQVGLELRPQHLPGVAEAYGRQAQQGELLLAFPLEEDDAPAPVYTP